MRRNPERERRVAATQGRAKAKAAALRRNALWQRLYGRHAAQQKAQRARLKTALQAHSARKKARAASEKNRRQSALVRQRARRAQGRAQHSRARANQRARAHRQRLHGR